MEELKKLDFYRKDISKISNITGVANARFLANFNEEKWFKLIEDNNYIDGYICKETELLGDFYENHFPEMVWIYYTRENDEYNPEIAYKKIDHPQKDNLVVAIKNPKILRDIALDLFERKEFWTHDRLGLAIDELEIERFYKEKIKCSKKNNKNKN